MLFRKVVIRLLTLALGSWSLLVQAQGSSTSATLYSQVSIASPTAASLGKFTDVPVSYHTGIPDVSVSLYTIKEGALTLPISLSYHAGGVKVLDPASWVGMNWALNAGGIITRSVMGAPDERGTTNATHCHFTDYGFSSYLTIGGTRGNNSTQSAPYDYGFATNIFDGEPDLFFFNFNGYSGKFYFNDDRTPVIVDGQDIKVEYYCPNPGSNGGQGEGNIQGFILTVPTGDRYYFGATDDLAVGAVKPVELTYPSSENSSNIDGHVFSSYYLHKIVAADGIHTISFDYVREKYSYYTLSTFPVSNFDRIPGVPYTYTKKEFTLVNNNLDGVRLTGIHFSTGDVVFTANTIRTDLGAFGPGGLDDSQNSNLQVQTNPAKALDQVHITTSGFCKQFTFFYSYYQAFAATLSSFIRTTNTPGINSDKTRLRLDKLVEQSCDGSQVANPWVFHYNGDYLPRRLSFAQDHWGFYNGAEGNNQLNTLISTYTLRPAFSYTAPYPGTQVPGANRDPALPYMAAGMLTQVTYPTGGSAVFRFEPNDVWTNYSKWVYSYLMGLSVGYNTGTPNNAWNFARFKANTLYKLTVDYDYARCNNPNGLGGAYLGFGMNPQISYSDTTLLSASSDNPHNTRTFTVAAGRHRVRLDMNSPACSTDRATASIEEITPVNIQANAYAGGLRIRTVTLKPSATAVDTVVTRYSYRYTNGHSTGALYNRPIYVQTVRNDQLALFGYLGDDGATHPETGGCLNPDISPTKAYLVSPCGIRPLSTTQGSHIGYDVVTVTKTDSSRTVYRYADTGVGERTYQDVCVRTIDPSFCDLSAPNQPAGPANYEYDRGQLKYQSEYNAQWRVVKTTAYHHDYDSTKLVTPAYMARYIAGAGLAGSYVRRGYWQTKATTTETLYDLTGTTPAPIHVQSQVQYFASQFHHQVTRTVQTAFSGDTMETRNRYAFDLRAPGPDALADGTASYTTACASCNTKYYNRLSACSNDSCRYNAYTDNLICRAAARQNYVNYRRLNFTDPGNTFQARHDAAKNNADASLRPLLQFQDDGRLEIVETSHWKNHQLLSATYTTFGPGLSQPTILYPARQFSLFLTAPSTIFSPATVNGNLVQRDARYATIPETTLTFDKGTLLQVLPKTGIVTSYIWGYQNTLPIVKAVGAPYTTLQAAYSSAGGNLTTLRSAPTLVQAQLTTYTHQPLVGLLSQTDPTGRPTTYEYDGLGRLVRIRDEQNHILGQQQYHYAGQP